MGRQFHAAAFHNDLGRFESFFGFVGHDLARTAPAKGGNEVADVIGPKKIAPHAHDRSGIEHGIDAGFAVVAHDEAAEAQSGGGETFLHVAPEFDLAVIVFEVGIVGIGSQIAPLSEHAVSEETVVALVAESGKHAVIDLPTDFAVWPDRGCAVDLGPHFQGGIVAQRKGAAHQTTFHDRGVLADVHRAVGHIKGRSFYRGSRLDEQLIFPPDDPVGIG